MNKHQTNVLNMSFPVSEQLTRLVAGHAFPTLAAGHAPAEKLAA